jgi:hypothetical protein
VSSTTSGSSALCYFRNLNQLAVASANVVELLDTSDNVVVTLNVPSIFSVRKMAWANNKLYIATTVSFGKALVFEWDGLGSEAGNSYPVEGHTVFSIVPYKDGVSYITSKGELYYNRGGSQYLDSLPVAFKDDIWQDRNSIGDSINIRVGRNAMAVDGDNIYIGVNSKVFIAGDTEGKRMYSDFISGVWCYNPKVGLHHKFSIDNAVRLKTSAITTANVNTGTDVITVSGVTVPETGTPVYYFNQVTGQSTNIGGLTHSKKYFTIKLSGTTLKLASSYDNAISNTSIDLTGTGNNSQYLIFYPKNTIGDFNGVVQSICILNTNVEQVISPKQFGKILIGGYSTSNSGTQTSFIASVLDDVENRGYWITPKLESKNIEDIFKSIIHKFQTLKTPEDKIIIKYRTKDNTLRDYETYNSVNSYTSVWVNGNSYTTTEDISNVAIGDEVEFYGTQGAGYLAHITDITQNAGTYTVTIDETIPSVTAGDKVRVLYGNWKKIATITQNDSLGFILKRITKNAKWIQFKFELRGSNILHEETIVDNVPHLPVSQ